MRPSNPGKKGKPTSIHNERLVQFSVDNVADAILWIDMHGSITYVNKAAIRSLGYLREELMHMSVFNIDPNFPVETWPDYWARMKAEGSAIIESVHRAKDGRTFPVEIRVNYLECGGTEFHCAFVRDITERKKREQVLKENEERFRRTLDVTSDGMWDRDLRSGAVYYGSNWATALGYREEDLLSGKISWEKLLHPDDRENAIQAVRDHLQGKTKNYATEFRLLNSENDYQWMFAKGKVIETDEEGGPLRFVGTHTDITQRKRVEEALFRTSEKIKMFTYSVVHDLKNPAIAIHGLVRRLQDNLSRLTPDKQISYCNQLLRSSEQIVDLVEKINTFIISKETPIYLEDVSLKEVLRTVHEEFATQLQVRSIEWYEFQNYPIVKADRVSLLRVLRNFIDNSLKYGGDSLSKIAISYQNTSGFHVISVRDNGVGMKKEEAESIFMPFKRKQTSSGKCGSGLGLAIVKEIADHHKGEVWIEHKTKRGIRFCFAISKNL